MQSRSEGHIVRQRVAVLGGGITGLTTAWRLGQQGFEVELFESSSQLGGLGQSFEAPFGRIDRFYHCILPSDRHLLALIEELGLKDDIQWKSSGMGFIHRGQRYPLNTPWDLLRFGALPIRDRLRMGWGTLGLKKHDPGKLDDIPAEEWLRSVFGDRCFEVVWKALLQAKFGDAYHEIPALWIWSRLHREKDGIRPEVKGMLPGGLKTLVDRLEESLRDAGVHLRKRARVESIRTDAGGAHLVADGEMRNFDSVVLAMATRPAIELLEEGSRAARQLAAHEVPYQGVVNVVFATREPMDHFYWLPVVDSGVGFQGIVETTQVADPAEFDGHHLVYVMNYLRADHAMFREDEDALADRYLAQLQKLYPSYGRSGIACQQVFRAPFVEPIYSLGYSNRRPPEVLEPDRIYLCNTSQIYPDITSWNSCIGRAGDLAERLGRERRDISSLEPATLSPRKCS
ncbi:MAG: FAD-dependent oxidoreductase [Planctomycetota bacterium]